MYSFLAQLTHRAPMFLRWGRSSRSLHVFRTLPLSASTLWPLFEKEKFWNKSFHCTCLGKSLSNTSCHKTTILKASPPQQSCSECCLLALVWVLACLWTPLFLSYWLTLASAAKKSKDEIPPWTVIPKINTCQYLRITEFFVYSLQVARINAIVTLLIKTSSVTNK